MPGTLISNSTTATTVKRMFTNPGEVIRSYIGGSRLKYLTPFKYFTLTLGIVIALQLQVDLGGIMISGDHMDGGTEVFRVQLIKFVIQYFNILQLLMLPIISWLTFIFFRNHSYNFAENIVINSYLFGQRNLLNILFILAAYLLPQHELITKYIFVIVWFVYFAYGYISVYQPKTKLPVILKTLLAMIILILVYSLLMLAIFALFFYDNTLKN